MASELRVNTLKDASGNNSIGVSYVAEGTAKQWSKVNQDALSITDSFNTASIADVATGEYSCNFTSNMSNANYANSCMKEAEASNSDCTEYTTNSNSTALVRRQDVEQNAGRDAGNSNTITIGDLA